MINTRSHRRIGKVCALVGAAVIFPLLAHAQQVTSVSPTAVRRYSVPEGGSGIVLLTTAIGAVLLFSWRQSSRAKAGSQPRRP